MHLRGVAGSFFFTSAKRAKKTSWGGVPGEGEKFLLAPRPPWFLLLASPIITPQGFIFMAKIQEPQGSFMFGSYFKGFRSGSIFRVGGFGWGEGSSPFAVEGGGHVRSQDPSGPHPPAGVPVTAPSARERGQARDSPSDTPPTHRHTDPTLALRLFHVPCNGSADSTLMLLPHVPCGAMRKSS